MEDRFLEDDEEKALRIQACSNQTLASSEGLPVAMYQPIENKSWPGLTQPHYLDVDSLMLFGSTELARKQREDSEDYVDVLWYKEPGGTFKQISERSGPSEGDIERLQKIYTGVIPGVWNDVP